MAKRYCLQSLYVIFFFFFEKLLRIVDEDGALTPTVPVVEVRVKGTRLISFLTKPFQSKGY